MSRIKLVVAFVVGLVLGYGGLRAWIEWQVIAGD